jgi:hypothetical protein
MMMTAHSEKYAFLELFGHNCLGICAVREVVRYGETFCEASPLDADGKPGLPQLIAGKAIYREQPVDEATALSVAKRRLGYLPAKSESVEPIDADFFPAEDEPRCPLDDFLTQFTEPTGEVLVRELRSAYVHWCEQAGHEDVGSRQFGRWLAERANRDRIYVGISLTEAGRAYVRPEDGDLPDINEGSEPGDPNISEETSLDRFLREHVIEDEPSTVLLSDFRRAYKLWCKQEKETEVNLSTLAWVPNT